MSNLSLLGIENALHDLMCAWQEADTPEAMREAEQAIAEYAAQEVRKVDGIRAYLNLCESMAEAAKDEAAVQTARRAMWTARRDRLKAFCADVMTSIGKKRLDGLHGSLTLKGNGGVQPLMVTDESLLPDQYLNVTVKMPMVLWRDVLKSADRRAVQLLCSPARYRETVEPNNGEIRKALESRCEDCSGTGKRYQVTDALELDQELVPCVSCGGSGKMSVPGARLLPRGESLVIR